MKLGVRGRLFAASATVIVLVGLGAAFVAEREVRRVLGERTAAHLLAEARMAAPWIQSRPPAEAGGIATALAAASEADIVVLAGSPTASSPAALPIVADSTGRGMDRDTILGLPEIREAWTRGEGTWIGREPCAHATEGGRPCVEDGVAVAVRWQHEGTVGLVRLRRDLVEVDRAVANVRRVFVCAGLVGLMAALLMSALASHLVSRTLGELVRRARAMARGEGGRVAVPPDDALGGLAGSINALGGELERTVRETARQRDLLVTVLEAMADGILALDRDLRLTAANRAAAELLGEAVRSSGTYLIETIRSPDVLGAASRARDGEAAEVECDLHWPRQRRILASAHPLAHGGCVLVLRDVTETRRLEAVRRDFVASASHELRTPVAAIRAGIEALADGAAADPEAGPALVEGVQRNVLRLSRLVDDLLDLSRLETGRRDLVLEALDVEAVVSAALSAMDTAAREKGIALAADVPPGSGVTADAGAMEEVLGNLLDNAVKYTPAGGRIDVVAAREGYRLRIEVRDTGPGIPPSHRERVFERFHRVDAARSRALGGTGLGLSIVKHLVEAMDGAVTLECPDAGGSVFGVHLPAADLPSPRHGVATDGG